MKKLFAILLLVFAFSFAESQPSSYSEWFDTLGHEPDSVGGVILEPLKTIGDSNTFKAATDVVLGSFTIPLSCDTNSFGLFDFFPIGAMFVIIAIVIALLNIAGQVFQSPNLIAYSKEELRILLVTVVIIVLMLGAFTGANAMFSFSIIGTNDIVYGSSPTMIDAAINYSKFLVYQISADWGALLVFNTILHTLYSATVYVGLTFKAMFSFNVGPVLKPLVDILGLAIQFLGVALGEWMVHIAMLCFIKKWIFAIILPFGVLLRAIPLTRSAGDTLLALGFALVFVYPIMLIANWEAYKVTAFVIIPDKTLIQGFFEDSGIFGVGIFGILLLATLGSVIMPFLMGYMVSLAFELVKNAVFYIVIISLLLPFFNIFITLTAAREISRALGSDVNFSSFVKLI